MSTHDQQLRHDTPGNIDKLAHARDLWETLLTDALCEGFTGIAWLRLHVVDGTIAKVTAHHRRTV